MWISFAQGPTTLDRRETTWRSLMLDVIVCRESNKLGRGLEPVVVRSPDRQAGGLIRMSMFSIKLLVAFVVLSLS